jgi:hypothetical protein
MKVARTERLPDRTDAQIRIYTCPICGDEMRLTVWADDLLVEAFGCGAWVLPDCAARQRPLERVGECLDEAPGRAEIATSPTSQPHIPGVDAVQEFLVRIASRCVLPASVRLSGGSLC